jgi:branched-chain amino acid transport system substrate-binding protein
VDRRALVLVAGLMATAGLTLSFMGCGKGGNSTTSSSNVIRIVSSLPRTGSAQGQTDSIVNGIQMAIDDYKGEVAGFKIEFSDMDDATAAAGQWAAESEGANAQKAAADKDVMVFIGPYNSGAAKVSMPILNEEGVLQISPAATWPGLTKKVPGDDKSGEPEIYRKSGKVTFCRVCPTDFLQGPLSAVFAKEELKAKTVYILDDKELYGQGIATLFKKKAEELGIKVLGHESIVVTQQEFGTLMTKIKALNPDLIYFGGTTQSKGGQIAKDMKNAGITCPMMAPDGCYEQAFIDSAGADVLNGRAYCTISGADPSKLTGSGAEFVKKYKEKFKKDPEPYAIFGYDAGKVFLEAVKKVGKKDRNAIREAVLATKDFTAGALGKWSFDADGDTTLEQLTVSVVKNGKFEPVKTISK